MASPEEHPCRNKRLFVILANARMTMSPEAVSFKGAGQQAGVELI
jgi:hypothetical protein